MCYPVSCSCAKTRFSLQLHCMPTIYWKLKKCQFTHIMVVCTDSLSYAWMSPFMSILMSTYLSVYPRTPITIYCQAQKSLLYCCLHKNANVTNSWQWSFRDYRTYIQLATAAALVPRVTISTHHSSAKYMHATCMNLHNLITIHIATCTYNTKR